MSELDKPSPSLTADVFYGRPLIQKVISHFFFFGLIGVSGSYFLVWCEFSTLMSVCALYKRINKTGKKIAESSGAAGRNFGWGYRKSLVEKRS